MKYDAAKCIPCNRLFSTHEHLDRFAMFFTGQDTIYLNPDDAKTLQKRLTEYLKAQKTGADLSNQNHNRV